MDDGISPVLRGFPVSVAYHTIAVGSSTRANSLDSEVMREGDGMSGLCWCTSGGVCTFR